MRRPLLSAAWLLLLTTAVRAQPLALQPCQLEGPPGAPAAVAECGTLSVAENPSRPEGKRIQLFVARIPARTATPAADAFTAIAGGPGGSSVDFYLSYRHAFERVRSRRDILLVDQRGTGRSNALDCPQQQALENNEPSRNAVITAARECLAELPGDPRYYTTSVAVRDLEQVRRVLGYRQLDLYGVSYGTRVAEHYLRRYPEHTRTVVLDGVVPPGRPLGPEIPLTSQEALDGVFRRCAADASCQAAFPDLPAAFYGLVSRLKAQPARLSAQNPLSGAPEQRELTDMDVRMVVRMLLYSPYGTALIPLLVREAADGDLAPLSAQLQMVNDDVARSVSAGMHNAVVCTEDVPFFDQLDVSHRQLQATYLGSSTVDLLRAVCSVWPRGVMDPDLREPLHSDRPVLLLSGEYDPITPPRFAAKLLPGLGSSRHIVAPGQGHGVAIAGCLPRLLGDFIEAASSEDLDAGCVARLVAPPFFLGFAGPAP